MSKSLDLVQRDPFFDDDFFTDSWSDFDTAMQSVLDKFDDKGLKVDTTNRSKCTEVYRDIRSTNIDQDLYNSQALQVTEKDGKFQCVMDVKDFNPNQLQVKVVENRVVVEGKYEMKSEDGTSVSSKSFYREFTLPGSANLDLVATALSKDGVLTIKAPKMEGSENKSAVSTDASQVQKQSSSSVQESSTSSTNESSSFQKTVKQSFTSSTQSSSFTSSNVSSDKMLSFDDDISKEMNDRLLFSHDNFNLKLKEQ